MELRELPTVGQSTLTPFPEKAQVQLRVLEYTYLGICQPAMKESLTEGNFVIREKKAPVPPSSANSLT